MTQPFVPIWTPEFSYFAGFVWADGYLWTNKSYGRHNIILENLFDDLSPLLPHFKDIGHFILYPLFKKLSSNKFLRATLSSKSLFEYLVQHGYKEKHSSHLILSEIPDNRHNYFWRGLWDGDGTVTIHERKNRNSIDYWTSVCSHKNQDWSALYSRLNNLGINFTSKVVEKTSGSNSQVFIAQLESIVNWKKYLYGDGKELDIGFPRKFNKFLTIEEHYYNSRMYKSTNLEKVRDEVYSMFALGENNKTIEKFIHDEAGVSWVNSPKYFKEWRDDFCNMGNI